MTHSLCLSHINNYDNIRLVICFITPRPSPPVLLLLLFLLLFWSLFCFVASAFWTTVCHLAIVNVCVIIILSIGNTQISILLLCFLYLFVELMITMDEYILFKPDNDQKAGSQSGHSTVNSKGNQNKAANTKLMSVFTFHIAHILWQ